LSADAPHRPSVSDLLAKARAGEPGPLDELFSRCRGYLGLVARAQVESWLRAKVDASDLVQESLLDAYRGFRGFRGTTEAEWLAWLKQIVNHNAANFVRHYGTTGKRRVGREVPLAVGAPGSSAAAVDPADPGESPSQQVMRKEREWQVAEALGHLTEDHRDVIVLRNLQRLPFDEVAARLGRSRPAAQMLWMRAMHALQQALEAESSGNAPAR
jgi:RNA polymerase sigma-70 factor, ECF subfamily